MIELSVTIETVRKRLNEIFDFIFDEETGEPLEDKLNNAWHEIFGTQSIFIKANVKSFDDAAVAAEYNDIRKAFSDAMTTIEHLYDEQVAGKKNL